MLLGEWWRGDPAADREGRRLVSLSCCVAFDNYTNENKFS